MRRERGRTGVVAALVVGGLVFAGCAVSEASAEAAGPTGRVAELAERVADGAGEVAGRAADRLPVPTTGASEDASSEGVGENDRQDATPTASPSTDVTELPALVDNAAWVTREGETALVISPSDLLRESSSTEVHDEAWRRVVAAVPDADTPGMRDQFVCHAVFASGKEGWYLEPRRPAVGYWRTVSAGCNPGDVTDVG